MEIGPGMTLPDISEESWTKSHFIISSGTTQHLPFLYFTTDNYISVFKMFLSSEELVSYLRVGDPLQAWSKAF